MDQEVEKKILDHIQAGHHFLLSGGAGSGKTYTLVQVIRKVLELYPGAQIACMTYTNAAASEIERRIDNSRLSVSTIHDFLWSNIRNYQRELKTAIINLANDEDSKLHIPDTEDGHVPVDYYEKGEEPVTIDYREYLSLKDGIISHNEVLMVAQYLFCHYPRLVNIVKSKYHFYFIDEYQDTLPEVIQILMEDFPKTEKSYIVGFFGDSMQAIYEDGVGDIDQYLNTPDQPNGMVYEVRKLQNRRCPRSVITLANKIRTDRLVQKPSDDASAPNMVNGEAKEGTCRFFYSKNVDSSENLRRLLKDEHWDLDSADKFKELRLTYNLIAKDSGFPTLLEIYDKDLILEYARGVKKYLEEKGFDTSSKTFGEVLRVLEGDQAYTNEPWKAKPAQEEYIKKNAGWFEFAKSVDFDIISKNYVYKEQLLDFRTETDNDKSTTQSRQCDLIKHLFKIETCIRYYQKKQYNDFLRLSSIGWIHSVSQKRELKEAIGNMDILETCSIGDVIDRFDQYNICKIDDRVNAYIQKYPYTYTRVRNVNYKEFMRLYDFENQLQPFTTQHKVKGLEFDNVLVILDNGKWSKYNFNSLFARTNAKESVSLRTRKLFYVCCTRAKENLVVYMPNAKEDVIEGAKSLFGDNQVFEV